ncbi:MAG: glycogen/starch/alpha-glucan phosphorylase, partial [Planctomycetota bacterium]
QKALCECEGVLNMTFLALNLSRYVNGVAKRHAEVAGSAFGGFAQYTIDSITNGVHAATWTSRPFQELFDRHVPGWRQDAFNLRHAESLPKQDVWQAHRLAKERLIQYVNREDNVGMDIDVFTLGYARRAASYKRAGLLFHDIEWLRQI